MAAAGEEGKGDCFGACHGRDSRTPSDRIGVAASTTIPPPPHPPRGRKSKNQKHQQLWMDGCGERKRRWMAEERSRLKKADPKELILDQPQAHQRGGAFGGSQGRVFIHPLCDGGKANNGTTWFRTSKVNLFFKLLIKHKLQNRLQAEEAAASSSCRVTTRPEEPTAPANLSFGPDGVATKDIHVDPLFSCSLRIFLPDAAAAAKSLHRAPNLDDQENCTRRSNYHSSASAHENDDDPAADTGTYSEYLPSVMDVSIVIYFRGGGWEQYGERERDPLFNIKKSGPDLIILR
ncbi:hypothetical protein Cni_G01532 [Canna indica]|uniref:Uncharacterized protein n=1 Tax=Canna indica TaxID=4628 RepID=A0AAQ3JQQ6_9LILI|nr:hypothetical protein Cni_G01532 [Canna indica]